MFTRQNPIWLRLFPAILSLIAIAAVGTYCLRSATLKPKIFVSCKDVDFGLVPPDESAEYPIEITNLGSANLILSEMKTSCSCSIASIGKSTLAPSETTKLLVQVKGSPRPTSSTSVSFRTNDLDNSVITIPLYFRSRSGMWIEPEVLSFGHLDGADNGPNLPRREFAIESEHHLDIETLKADSDESFSLAFSHSVFQRIGSDVRVSITPRANLPCGFVRGQFFVRDQNGNIATLTAEAFVACDDKVVISKPILMKMSPNGDFFGEGAIKLVDGLDVRTVLSRVLSKHPIEICSVIGESEIKISCRAGTSYEEPKRYTAEIIVEEVSGSRTIVWLPIVVYTDLQSSAELVTSKNER
jgi:hypothetical protein